jgi:hypothetical protein
VIESLDRMIAMPAKYFFPGFSSATDRPDVTNSGLVLPQGREMSIGIKWRAVRSVR